jgi:hypothetical protein
MAERSGATRAIVAVVCLGVTVLGLINTYGDNAEVVTLAQKTACGSPGCTFNTLRQERSPLSQSFGFQVKTVEKGRERGATADVTCKRAYVLFGDYGCVMTSGGLPTGP